MGVDRQSWLFCGAIPKYHVTLFLHTITLYYQSMVKNYFIILLPTIMTHYHQPYPSKLYGSFSFFVVRCFIQLQIQMTTKQKSRSKTPLPLHIQSVNHRKRSHSVRRSPPKLQFSNQNSNFKYDFKGNKDDYCHQPMAQMGSLELSRILHEGEIQFMVKHIKVKEQGIKKSGKFNVDSFEFISVLGCGMFGRVWKCKEKGTGKLYAIKQMSKAQIISKKGLKVCLNERELLPELNFSLIPSLYCTFQSETDLYLVFALLSGGDMRYHITKFKYFQEKQIRFFAACIVASLSYLRMKAIIHRDLKPENLILDSDRYLCLADFGISSKIDSYETFPGGTPAYMSPEVLLGKQAGFQSDYYGLGVILYEMIIGQRPYITSDRQQLKERMLKNAISIKKQNIPEGWSIEAIDFVNRLLHRNPKNRLGSNGIHQLKKHAWLRNFPWHQLQQKKIKSPYCHEFKEWEIDYSKFSEGSSNKEMVDIEKQLVKGHMQQLFRNYELESVDKSVAWSTKPSLEIRR